MKSSLGVRSKTRHRAIPRYMVNIGALTSCPIQLNAKGLAIRITCLPASRYNLSATIDSVNEGLRRRNMKILMALTSHDVLGNTGRKTGFWMEQLAAPYFLYLTFRQQLTLPSPKLRHSIRSP